MTQYGDRNKKKTPNRTGPRVAPENKKDILIQCLLTKIQADQFVKDYSIRTDGSRGITLQRILTTMLDQAIWKDVGGRLHVEFPTGRMVKDAQS